MTPRRFQFTIRGLLWATFWVAAACALFWSPRPAADPQFFNRSLAIGWGIPIIVVFCLCAAGGSVLGSHRKGLLLGLVIVGGWLAWLGIMFCRFMWH